MSIKDNVDKLRTQIESAATRTERNPDEITIVAVSKEFPVERIEEAIACGIRIIGENRVQEADRKYSTIGDRVDWHMVGHLQTNKVKEALKIFDMIQSLDSLRLAEEIEKRAGKPIDCLIEVNTSKEPTKFGISPNQVFDFYENIAKFKKIDVQGLMTIGPGWAIEDPEASRPCFRMLRDLRDEMSQEFDRPFSILSMGMTADFEVAIAEGSTMIRVGTAIFGPRK
ncbi:MAG: YggS family pyridoxal phosphate-dependent enzyme [candidate division WOR-3 bacterium]|nr:MAG: YggS family pyridoxal phosphate-dependent enzyme [candidate division WOR-3 bacterium]